eukprot:11577538-Karenia_brevis.AAC.1
MDGSSVAKDMLKYRNCLWYEVNRKMPWQHRVMHNHSGTQSFHVEDPLQQFVTQLGYPNWLDLASDRLTWK